MKIEVKLSSDKLSIVEFIVNDEHTTIADLKIYFTQLITQNTSSTFINSGDFKTALQYFDTNVIEQDSFTLISVALETYFKTIYEDTMVLYTMKQGF